MAGDKFADMGGRIEEAYFKEEISGHSSLGEYGTGREVVITHATGAGPEDSCLVRFDSRLTREKEIPLANFLTSQVPEGFEGLDFDAYILCGIWTPEMQKSSEAPCLSEMNSYYEPGRVGIFYFLQENSSNARGRFSISSRGPNHEKISLGRIIRKLPDPRSFSRLIIGEGEAQVRLAEDAVTNAGLTPVRLEPLLERAVVIS